MTSTELRREIKKLVDRVPPERLQSLLDYVHFLRYSEMSSRLTDAEREISGGKGQNWRTIRNEG